MKKKVILMWSLCTAMAFSACTEKEDNAPETKNVEFAVKLNFSGADTRATPSTAVPVTSWGIINEVQFFLYEKTTKVVKFSAVETPTGTGTKEYVYTSVPQGDYILVAVASTKARNMSNITPFGAGATGEAAWDRFNVLDKNIEDLYMTHKEINTGFPAFIDVDYKNDPLMKAYSEPAEIFMGYEEVEVEPNKMNNATVKLERQVSLMRVRLNIGANDKVEFTGSTATASSILVRHLPNKMGIEQGNAGGVSADVTLKNVQVASGSDVFNTVDPTSGYAIPNNPTGTPKILDAGTGFIMWRDIIVFPNSERGDANLTDDADGNRRYLIAISGLGKVGHVLANGDVLTVDTPVYWTGTVTEKFVANEIREVNITLNTGGYTDLPTTEFGDLTITVSEPEPWNAVIQVSDIYM